MISLSLPSSVEDKRCGFDLMVARQSLARHTATIRWAPTERQLADALTKDCATAMNLLRSCLRKGEYQLSQEQTMLQRAADERDRRKRDRCQLKTDKTDKQSGSPKSSTVESQQSESIGPVHFVSQSSDPVCARMECGWCVPSMGNDVQVRSLLESLTTFPDMSNESSAKVKVSADVVDLVEFKGSKTLLTLSWSRNSRTFSSARSDGHGGSRPATACTIDGGL